VDLAAMFEMFTQVAAPGEHSEGGLGIGLALVKGLVALHGGTIEARSAGIGQGAEFIIRLPGSVVVDATANSALEPTSVAISDGPRSCKILVADDNPIPSAYSLSTTATMFASPTRVTKR
jgi:hypothetical protein